MISKRYHVGQRPGILCRHRASPLVERTFSRLFIHFLMILRQFDWKLRCDLKNSKRFSPWPCLLGPSSELRSSAWSSQQCLASSSARSRCNVMNTIKVSNYDRSKVDNLFIQCTLVTVLPSTSMKQNYSAFQFLPRIKVESRNRTNTSEYQIVEIFVWRINQQSRPIIVFKICSL